MTLELEYLVTEAERKQAQELHLRQHYGKGSKWRTRLVLFGLLALGAGAVYMRITTGVEKKDRPWFIALLVFIAAVYLIIKWRSKRKEDPKPARVRVTERGLEFSGTSDKVTLQWSGFAQCLESPELFVLVDRTKSILYTLPKRAFADQAGQSWFRTMANQPQSVAPADRERELSPGRFASGGGISLAHRLGYRDYLSRNLASWRMKGIGLLLLVVLTGAAFLIPAPAQAVNPPLKVWLIMLGTMTPMFGVVFFLVCFIAWRAERKFLKSEQIVVSENGIEFAGADSSGRLNWSSYKYYCENRWSFFVWNTQGPVWFMFPKRLFGSALEVEQFRSILERNLNHSRWFFL